MPISNNQLRRLLMTTLTCLLLLAPAGCVSSKAVKTAIQKSAVLPPPVPVRRPLDSVLADFGVMVGPYVTAATGEQSIPIEIDFISNESGIDKELPTDLGQYARNAIDKIGGPFQTYRTWPTIATLPRPSGGSLPLLPNDRPKPPQPAYRLVGSLLRASERLVQGKDARTDGQFGGGHTQSDVQLTGDQRRTITSLTIALTLEAPTGVAVPGATAVYRIEVEKNELNRSVSIYVAGSGIGGGSKFTTTQDSGDALYDATAIAVVHLLGNALMVPYFRCSPLFQHDAGLEKRVRDALVRLTRAEVEQVVKRYLFVSGHSMDMRMADPTEADRAIIQVEMQHRSFDYADRSRVVDFAIQLWNGLDYVKGAKRVAERLALSAQVQREQIQQAAREASAKPQREIPSTSISPVEFGWVPSVRFVIIDLSRIKRIGAQEQVLAALRACSGCDDLRVHPTKMLLGIRLSVPSSEVQKALRQASLPVNYVWSDSRQQLLLLLPK